MTQTQAQARRVTYEGNPGLARALAQLLEEEGVSVDRGRSPAAYEQRDNTGTVEPVVCGLLVYGTTAAINAAVSSFRRRFPGSGTVTIEPDEGDED